MFLHEIQQVICSLIKLLLHYIRKLAQTCDVKIQSSNLTQRTANSETANDVRRMSERDRCRIQQRFEIERGTNDSISTMQRDSTLKKKSEFLVMYHL